MHSSFIVPTEKKLYPSVSDRAKQHFQTWYRKPPMIYGDDN